MTDKYNYFEALELLKNAYESGAKVTYKDMEDVLGLEHPIDDKKYASTNNSALYELRNRLKNQYGLTFKSAASSWHSGPDYHYYIIVLLLAVAFLLVLIQVVVEVQEKSFEHCLQEKEHPLLH